MALPDNVDFKDKYYVGYFKNEKLIAVLDLIDGYCIHWILNDRY